MERPGVLALQGDFREHLAMFAALGVEPRPVRLPDDLSDVDGLVIPGGESTAIGKLLERSGLMAPLRARAYAGMPVMGTCAGMILMAHEVLDAGVEQPSLDLLDVVVRRNAFGRQVDSFITELEVVGAARPVRAAFIRAPQIESMGAAVTVLASLAGRPVAVREGNLMALAFHPELLGESHFHRQFLGMTEGRALEAEPQGSRHG